MTPKQERFVEEYLIDLNATQAAIRAGYGEKGARTEGARQLANVCVQEALAKARNERAARVEISQDYVLSSLQEVAERCLQRVPVMVGQGKDRHQLEDEDGNGVWDFNAAGANKALELLGKHLALFTEKHEHTGKDGGAIEIDEAKRVSRLASILGAAAKRRDADASDLA